MNIVHFDVVAIPIFRLVFQIFAPSDCVPCILYPIISPYFLFGRFVIEIWRATSVREMSDYL